MFSFVKNLFNYHAKELQRIDKIVLEINALSEKAASLSNEQFPEETKHLKEEIALKKKNLDEILPWAFALVREAAMRVLHERHYDVQLVAGIGLHEGKIIEQKTGEGKTLSATSALYLNALTGKGVHLVTVNDYLARRDAGWMGAVFHFLGLTTSALIADKSYIFDPNYVEKNAQDRRLAHLRPISRKEAYMCDVTYGINSEFGFDYLRDNMATSKDELVQHGFYYAVIDEADSVLIDEARTPHIISAPFQEETSKYYTYAKMVKKLDPKTDYVIDEKSRTAHLTESGIKNLENQIGVENIYEKDFDTLFHVEAALKAEALFKNNKDYIVRNNEVVIVDEFTGRLLEGRRFSEGIHQAIEAKEGVAIQRESKTLATVSLQNYFRMYEKISGMTGTAATESEEFHKIYKADVLIAPTHRKTIRIDHPDMIYKTEKGKWNAVVDEIIINYKKGRPVLVGTTSIEKNEHLSHLLNLKNIPHELLNAKNHEREASIIASAGKKGAVTVATNMAGRGVDIILGGAPPEFEKKKDEKDTKAEEQFAKAKAAWQKEHDEVVAVGGLYVIGTERHESRRIDNQLRGRAGRQGDPGETCFFVALEDDLMRIFGGEQISRLMTFFNFPEDQPLSHSMVSKAIEQAQVKVEGFNFDIRKHLVDYDDVLNKQREIIYSRRRKVLHAGHENANELQDFMEDLFDEEVSQVTATISATTQDNPKQAPELLYTELNYLFPISKEEIQQTMRNNDAMSNIESNMMKKFENEYEKRNKEIGTDLWKEIVKNIYFSTVDKYWTDHLTAIEDVREGINLRGYAQLDPLVEYKNEAYSMFEKLISDIDYEVTRRLFKVKIEMGKDQEIKKNEQITFKSASSIDPFAQTQKNDSPKQEQQPENTQEGFRIIAPGASRKKLGRNDPCWCGSGKKYKKCHYPN